MKSGYGQLATQSLRYADALLAMWAMTSAMSMSSPSCSSKASTRISIAICEVLFYIARKISSSSASC